MNGFLKLIFAGMVVTTFGFLLLFLFFNGYLPQTLASILMPIILLGMLLMLVIGPILFLLQKPTKREIDASDPSNPRTWHFRPVGLLVVAISAGLIKWFANFFCQKFTPVLFEPFVQLSHHGARMSILDITIVLLVVLLPIIPSVRNFLFFYPKNAANDKP